jgi:hypothetical protein
MRAARARAARAALAALTALSLAAPAAAAPAAGRGRYDPCTEAGLATKVGGGSGRGGRRGAAVRRARDPPRPQSRGLHLGLALWPGAPADHWGDAASGAHPCAPAAARNGSAGAAVPLLAAPPAAAVAPYSLRVDGIASLRVEADVMLRLLDAAAAGGRPAAVSGVLFRGAVRSPPRLVASADAGVGAGAGLVTTLVADLVLTKGRLARIDWSDVGCAGCGGRGGGRCAASPPLGGPPQLSCAAPADACRAGLETPNATLVDWADGGSGGCGLSVHVGFSGTDRAGAPLATGGQLRALRAASVADLADAIRARVTAVVEGAGAGYMGDAGPADGGAADAGAADEGAA